MKSCSAAAPCSTANLGPGYDVFGLALDAFEDKVKVSRASSDGEGRISIKNSDQAIPSTPESNSAGLVAKKMMQDFGISYNTEIEVTKGVPSGYGVGSSAASAAAAAMAFSTLYDLKIDKNRLVEYAAEGEVASAGTKHYDNVSASLLGGFVVCRIASDRLQFTRLEPPKDLVLVIAVPWLEVPKKKTEVARSVLPKVVPLKDVVHNISGAATIVAGFALKDVETITKGIDDAIIEPARKHLIPGYDSVKQNAISAGALAVTISGAGPSMIAFLKTSKNAKTVAAAMVKGFKETGIESSTFVCRASKGARLLA
ncbi:MAG: homoserine kinase [Nitrososphaeraceae archaeon]|jgi:homoserine kinase|nr:homoserine kinase [Nitrososphaeraceae archaeon]MDW0140289.1 homoserine kinase [Nitrososphaeraceae archaeon]